MPHESDSERIEISQSLRTDIVHYTFDYISVYDENGRISWTETKPVSLGGETIEGVPDEFAESLITKNNQRVGNEYDSKMFGASIGIGVTALTGFAGVAIIENTDVNSTPAYVLAGLITTGFGIATYLAIRRENTRRNERIYALSDRIRSAVVPKQKNTN